MIDERNSIMGEESKRVMVNNDDRNKNQRVGKIYSAFTTK